MSNSNVTATDNVIEIDALVTVTGGVVPNPENKDGGCIPSPFPRPRPNPFPSPFPGPTFPRPPFDLNR